MAPEKSIQELTLEEVRALRKFSEGQFERLHQRIDETNRCVAGNKSSIATLFERVKGHATRIGWLYVVAGSIGVGVFGILVTVASKVRG